MGRNAAWTVAFVEPVELRRRRAFKPSVQAGYGEYESLALDLWALSDRVLGSI